MPLLNSLTPEGKLIQVTSTATKYANKRFLSRLGISLFTSSFGLKDGFGLDEYWVSVGLSASYSLW
jgi:hypothetical protein